MCWTTLFFLFVGKENGERSGKEEERRTEREKATISDIWES